MKIPLAIQQAPKILLPDLSGFLAALPNDGPGEVCPFCEPGQRGAMGLTVIRQILPSGEWVYSCLVCAGRERKVA